jgi:hypothetical protein
MVILGTEYAGEMKKGIFSVMHYLMPLAGHLTLHSGCNMGANKDVTLFFGLSGTGLLLLSTRAPIQGHTCSSAVEQMPCLTPSMHEYHVFTLHFCFRTRVRPA